MTDIASLQKIFMVVTDTGNLQKDLKICFPSLAANYLQFVTTVLGFDKIFSIQRQHQIRLKIPVLFI